MNQFLNNKILMTSIENPSNLQISPNGTINDSKYSHFGQYLAVCDSEGYLHIYHQGSNQKMIKQSSIKVDQGALLSLSWADPQYGNILGVGTFTNKVFVYQLQNQGWKQIAHNFAHQASVNCVEWSPIGLKLFSGSSDGKVSILECVKNSWKISYFVTGQTAIVALTLQPLSLGEIISPQTADKFYPRIAIAKKDMKIEVYAHSCEQFYQTEQEGKFFEKLEKPRNNTGYSLIKQLPNLKKTIRSMIWRPMWGSINESLQIIKLVYGTEEGNIESVEISGGSNEQVQTIICEGEIPYCHISQSLTGNLISASRTYKNSSETQVFEQIEDNKWKLVKNAKI